MKELNSKMKGFLSLNKTRKESNDRSRKLVVSRVIPIVFLLVLILALVRSTLFKPAGISRGSPNDLLADIVLGKDGFGEGQPGEIVPFKLMNPGGVTVDRSVRPNRIYVYDGSNSRILGFSSVGVCQNNPSAKCTADSDCPGSGCQVKVGGSLGSQKADLVIGQPDFYHSACNGDFNFQNYPQRATASATTLCSMPEYQISTTEGGSYNSLTVDKDGNLFVSDFDNNRVLKFVSPFTTDNVADQVWGQADFSGNACNRRPGDIFQAIGYPQNNTLCLRSPYNEGFVGSTDIDKNGHLWVTDNQNHRVLRFPKDPASGTIAPTADLVFGQPDFTTNAHGTTLNKMHAPTAVRTDPGSGRVYVADSWNNRILYFDPPYANGMAATGTFGSNLTYPTGIDFDPSGSGIWIDDSLNNQLVEFDMSGNILKVLFKDTSQPNGRCGSTTADESGCINSQTDPKTGQQVCWANMCSVTGSVGIDVDGNIYAGGPSFEQDVWRFKAPIPTPVTGKLYSASNRLFYPPDDMNQAYGNNGLSSARGLAVAARQLIVADKARLLFWNMPNGVSDLWTGKPPDGVAGVSNFDIADPWGFMDITAQGDQYLWVGHMGYIDVYQLPLTPGAMPTKTPVSLYGAGLPVLGGGNIVSQWNVNESWGDLEVTADGRYLWASQPHFNRVVRIANPMTSPTVDVILGQKSVTDVTCNQGDPNYPPVPGNSSNYPLNYLCYPGGVKIDRQGNLFVSDHWLEITGNFRILTFNAGMFPDNPTSVIYNPAATRAIPNVAAWKPAFDSQNHMVVGFNSYYGGNGRFPGVYSNPTTQTTPDKFLGDYFSMALFAAFDNDDNLYVDDLNRGRILIYKNPLASPLPTATAAPTPTQTVAPTPTATIAPTPPASTSIALRSLAVATNSSKVNRLRINLPAGVITGDVMIAQITIANGNAAITSPGGWTLIRRDTSGNSLSQALYYHVASGNEPSTFTFNYSPRQRASGGIIAYTGVNNNSPIEANSGLGSNSTTLITAPSITATSGNQVLFFGAVAAGTTITPPTGMTQRWLVKTSATTSEIADRALSTSGATGNQSGTTSSSKANIGQLVALKPGTTSTPAATPQPTPTPIPLSTPTATPLPTTPISGCTASCISAITTGYCSQASPCKTSGQATYALPKVTFTINSSGCTSGVTIDTSTAQFPLDGGIPSNTWLDAGLSTTTGTATVDWNFCNSSVCWTFNAGQTLYWRLRDPSTNQVKAICSPFSAPSI